MTDISTGIELATSPKGYKLILVDGRLMMLLSNGRQLELHLENFMKCKWLLKIVAKAKDKGYIMPDPP